MRNTVVAVGLIGLTTLLVPTFIAGAQESAPPKGEASDQKNWLTVAPGRVEPRSGEIRIGSPLVGRIAEVLVHVNDRVLAGEPLIRLDDDEVRLRYARAEAQVNVRKRTRGLIQAKGAERDRRRLEDAADAAARAVIHARTAADDAAAARRAGTGSDEALDKARAELTTAQRQSRQAQADLAQFDGDASIAPIDADVQLAMARFELRSAEAALDSLTIRAPIASTILQVNVRPGEIASPSALLPFVVLGDVSALRVRAEVDERDFGTIVVGHPVIVRSTAFRGRDLPGKVSSIAPTIGPGRIGASGQRSATDVNVAEVVIDLADSGPLAVGMKVEVYFRRDRAQQ